MDTLVINSEKNFTAHEDSNEFIKSKMPWLLPEGLLALDCKLCITL